MKYKSKRSLERNLKIINIKNESIIVFSTGDSGRVVKLKFKYAFLKYAFLEYAEKRKGIYNIYQNRVNSLSFCLWISL